MSCGNCDCCPKCGCKATCTCNENVPMFAEADETISFGSVIAPIVGMVRGSGAEKMTFGGPLIVNCSCGVNGCSC